MQYFVIYCKQKKNIQQKLLDERKKRQSPNKDDKILTDWNGLMIAALSKSTQILDEPKYLEAATKAADFIISKIRLSNGRLSHFYKDNEQSIYAYLDDYVFLIWGLIELYEATFNVDYLKSALELNEYLLKHFWDNERGGFYFSSDDSETILPGQRGSAVIRGPKTVLGLQLFRKPLIALRSFLGI